MNDEIAGKDDDDDDDGVENGRGNIKAKSRKIKDSLVEIKAKQKKDLRLPIFLAFKTFEKLNFQTGKKSRSQCMYKIKEAFKLMGMDVCLKGPTLDRQISALFFLNIVVVKRYKRVM